MIPHVQADNPKPSLIDTVTYDWPKFWQTFKTYSAWETEWFNGETWINHDSCMQIIRDYPEPNHVKITLNFTSEEPGSYRFTFAIDKRVKDYVEKISNWRYELTYEGFTVVFDWSDIKEIPNLIVSHGVQDGYFWFRIRKDNVPGNYNFVIDPSIIGTTTEGTSYILSDPCSRTIVYANGYYYATYSNGSHVIYKSSSNNGVALSCLRAWCSAFLISIWVIRM